MSGRRLVASLGLALLLGGGPAAAEEDSHRRAAERLLEAADTRATMDSAIDLMMQAQIRSTPQIAPFEGVLRTFLDRHVGYAAMKDELVSLYVADFTEAELDELAAFYRTPTGAKAVARIPILMSRGSQIGERRVRANQAELARMVQEEQRRLAPQPAR